MGFLREKYFYSKVLTTLRTRRYITSREWYSKDKLIIKLMMKENLWEGIGTATGVYDVDDRLFVKES